ncbi:DNA mismatch repair endonuclease MutL [Alteribacillus bidgolensis]|uniref:DNA mismatch repair protein MutL n=1 Tax=Alteribacillus bidgolensis TaxID=930129 RepID=A0A1G8D949_9BACI|nr:DNA mismatch repair endonuclease MutL [Alteribacillus bidgolensis]SDH54241.1 DNA mismatch repair protein MutL [Alteribacillus bidgolensis]
MSSVKKLSDDLSNKIAAGEVVERPASVVKELTENAIDAKSTRIDIQIQEGGLSEIRVVDNGKGMPKEDAEIAFLRHATSKIQTEKDLFRISTLGFRGEALPSIAAVSKLSLESGTGVGAGTLVRYQGGKRIAFSSAKSRRGTEVTVRDLFFNTPARLKYMKTINTEIGNISDVVNRLALANPHISFRLMHNKKQLLFTNGNGDMKAVIAAIYGRRTAQNFLSVKEESVDYKVEGFAAKPEINRASRQYISTFINGRYVRHFPLTKAIENAFHTLLPIGRYPLAVIHIWMHPVLIDVNVHPSKLEVRLSKEKELTAVLEEAIKAQLFEEQLIPEVDQKRGKRADSQQLNLTFSENKSIERPNPIETNLENIPSSYERNSENSSKAEETKIQEDEYIENKTPVLDEWESNEAIFRDADKEKTNEEVYERSAPIGEEISKKKVPELEVIGQMHGTYILAQNENGLYIIDQHAAQERIFYEHYREKIGETNPHLQDLIVPVTFEVSPREEMLITTHKKDLEKVGVFLEPFGTRTYRVTAHPAWFPDGEEESTIRELFEQLLENKKISIHKLREEAAILMSCKAAIKANRYLRMDEIHALIDRLRQCEVPFTCPHGRPIIIHFSGYDMEKMFKRVM